MSSSLFPWQSAPLASKDMAGGALLGAAPVIPVAAHALQVECIHALDKFGILDFRHVMALQTGLGCLLAFCGQLMTRPAGQRGVIAVFRVMVALGAGDPVTCGRRMGFMREQHVSRYRGEHQPNGGIRLGKGKRSVPYGPDGQQNAGQAIGELLFLQRWHNEFNILSLFGNWHPWPEQKAKAPPTIMRMRFQVFFGSGFSFFPQKKRKPLPPGPAASMPQRVAGVQNLLDRRCFNI